MELTEKLLKGDIASAAKLITMIENDRDAASSIIKEIFPHTGNAYLIGITGSPGVGKSTLVSQLVKTFRDRGNSIGVIAVDASSPFSGGALLGDRIRMQEHQIDKEGVFVRSMATRGNLGGLSKATRDAAYVMDAMGRDIIIIETVGVGQVELDIVKIAYSSLVVLAPGMGDSIQAMKAGIMEIADIFIINKADHDGADKTYRDVQYVLHMSEACDDRWHPEIYKTVASEGEGISEVVDCIEKHKKYLEETSQKLEKIYGREQLMELVKSNVEKRIQNSDVDECLIQEYVNKVINREMDPYTVSEMVLDKIFM
ncbi:MAG: methylmalonyl Co-A mutase-associated GTPase MeaB [Spirochaetota bacterium]|nr:methylmalonyl Co-A mutase-associated GTPase MeaB [Spirochaetota bacterium]